MELDPLDFFKAVRTLGEGFKPLPIRRWDRCGVVPQELQERMRPMLFDPSSSGERMPCGLTHGLYHSVHIGAGHHLDARWSAVMTESSLTLGLDRHERWPRLAAALYRAFEQFFQWRWDAPSMVWVHPVCWTDRSYSTTFYGATYCEHIPKVHPNTRDSSRKWFRDGFKLTFGPGNVGDPVVIGPNQFDWLSPDDMDAERIGLCGIVDYQEGLIGQERRSDKFRIQVGVGCRSAEFDPFLYAGFHPAQIAHLFPVSLDQSGAIRIHAPLSSGRLARPTDKRASAALRDGGVLDLCLFKGLRLIPMSCDSYEQVEYDELTFAIDPRLCRVAYVAAAHDRYDAFAADHFETTPAAQWLASHMP